MCGAFASWPIVKAHSSVVEPAWWPMTGWDPLRGLVLGCRTLRPPRLLDQFSPRELRELVSETEVEPAEAESMKDNPPAAPAEDSAAQRGVVIIGAGPAGLTSAHVLATRYGIASTILEADSVVGGSSRTVEDDGWRFDIGGHRFFTEVKEVEAFWHEILPDEDFLLRPRMSRIYYKGKYYDYPLKASNALRNLGLWEAFRCVMSYAWTRARPPKDQSTLEGCIVARFGWRLYRHFFKSYNEKLWGVPVNKLPADFAAQRIKNLSLSNAVINALMPKRNQKDITSLIEEFQYPKFGPGIMWERCRDLVEAEGCNVVMNTRVVGIRHEDGRAMAVIAEGRDGTRSEYPCEHVVSSMPISDLIKTMDPPPPGSVVGAARDHRYRDFLTVALVVPESAGFPDNWIYIHAPEVKVGRIQNFGSWSPSMVKEGRMCLGLEFFVFEGDETWNKSDAELIERGKRELAVLTFARPLRRRSRICRAHARGIPVLRRALQGQRGHHRRVDCRACAECPSCRSQRHASLQQPGSLDVHGHAHRREHRHRLGTRRVERERRGGVPRGVVDLEWPSPEWRGHRPGCPGHRPTAFRRSPSGQQSDRQSLTGRRSELSRSGHPDRWHARCLRSPSGPARRGYRSGSELTHSGDVAQSVEAGRLNRLQ